MDGAQGGYRAGIRPRLLALFILGPMLLAALGYGAHRVWSARSVKGAPLQVAHKVLDFAGVWGGAVVAVGAFLVFSGKGG
jgi:hypothetical protein